MTKHALYFYNKYFISQLDGFKPLLDSIRMCTVKKNWLGAATSFSVAHMSHCITLYQWPCETNEDKIPDCQTTIGEVP